MEQELAVPDESPRYAGFWIRLLAMTLDVLILAPFWGATLWINQQSRLAAMLWVVPILVVSLIYYVYLVRRFGGTPGKLILKMRICKVDGSAIGDVEAFLRYTPFLVLQIAGCIATICEVVNMNDELFNSLSFVAKLSKMNEVAPWWAMPMVYLNYFWTFNETLCLLINSKKQALHDLIAGTIVVRQ